VKTPVQRAFSRAIYKTAVPTMHEDGHAQCHDWFNRKITFEVLRDMGWNHLEATTGATKYGGRARERLERIFPNERFQKPYEKRTGYKPEPT